MEPLRASQLLADAAFDAWLDIEGTPGLHDEVALGADGTATTRADAVLDEAILEAAAQLGLSVLSEEAGFVDHGSEEIAVVDPLDGSRNAGRGIPLFCTSVAVGKRDLSGLQASVVRSLVTGDSYAAELGKGAWKNDERVTRPAFNENEVMVAVIADSSVDDVQREQERRGHHIRDLGSAAMELCLVGTGALDAFIVRRPWLRVIDIAAGVLFVREAGGVAIDPRTHDPLNTPFDLSARASMLAAGSMNALEAVL